MSCSEKPYCTFALTVCAAAWLLVAVFVSESALLRTAPALTIPIVLWTLVAGLLFAYSKNLAFRSFVDELGLRILIGLHLTRFVGVYFLYLAKRGDLPQQFALTAGWGDIAVAATALVLLFSSSTKTILIWNAFGLADILFVVFSAAAQLMKDLPSMHAFTELPLSLLPTFLVPLIIASHIVIFSRLRNGLPITLRRIQPAAQPQPLSQP